MSFFILALVAGLLHLVWENFHIGLYTGYEKMKGKLPVPVLATLGDIMYTFLAVFLVGIFKGNGSWFLDAHFLDYAGLVCLGVLIALFVEYKALALDRWKYRDSMPIIPILRVGVTPIVQMALILPLSIYLTRVFMQLIALS